jgi:hypothetical protein
MARPLAEVEYMLERPLAEVEYMLEVHREYRQGTGLSNWDLSSRDLLSWHARVHIYLCYL